MLNCFLKTFVLLAAVLSGVSSPAEESKPAAPSDSKPQPSWRWPKVVISKETTYFTEPLRPDGGVDYVAALNRKYSEGVTPENNAAVALWQAAGPKELDKKIRKRYFEMLGIAELPEKGDYLSSYDDLPEYKEAMKQPDKGVSFWQKLGEHERAAENAPWTREEYPLIATVLERNEIPLKILADGLQQARFYSPLVSVGDDSMFFCVYGPSSGISNARMAARLFLMRAMLRLRDGDNFGAWHDLLSLYRLGRLASYGPGITNWIGAASTFEGMANEAAVVLSQHEGLTVAQIRECQRQFLLLPSAQHLTEVFGVGERCASIESLVILARDSDEYFEIDAIIDQMLKMMDPKRPSGEPERKRRQEAFKKLAAGNDVDWNEVFRQYNVFWDRLTDANRCTSSVKTAAMLEALESETGREAKISTDLMLSEKPNAAKNMDSKAKAKHIANLAILPGLFFNWKAGGWIKQQYDAYDRMTQLAFALAGYRAEHQGKYPKTLAELAPKYIDEIPKDPFTDGEFRYKSDGDGYLLYSVGRNGRDDGGFGRCNMPDSATEEQQNAWDDVSIQTPQKMHGGETQKSTE